MRAGFQVVPFLADFRVSAARACPMLDLLPAADSLRQTETALRVWYGFLCEAMSHQACPSGAPALPGEIVSRVQGSCLGSLAPLGEGWGEGIGEGIVEAVASFPDIASGFTMHITILPSPEVSSKLSTGI